MVHVLDASRSVPVAQTLLDKARGPGFVEDVKEDYAEVRVHYQLHTYSSKRLTPTLQALLQHSCRWHHCSLHVLLQQQPAETFSKL